MARSRTVRLATLTLSNILIPLAVLVFATGFFPYKPFLPGLATFEDVQEPGTEAFQQPEAVFDRVVFMVVDALRSDFVYGYNSGFQFTQSLIQSGAAIPFTAHATPPTVTMPRVKALTTGSVPSFLDLILNFAESETTSSLATQDTWLAQIKAKGGKLVFYGDDTWLKLFPGDFFARSDGTSSFFVSDFTEVDNNVTRHVPDELARDDWNAMIMHYLGLDHIGHKTGPQGPNMLPKQREMDGIVQQIYEAMETQKHHEKTLLVLAGDHGMNAGGNHGGSGPGETEPALLFASQRFKDMKKARQYECPTIPKEGTEFHYYTKLEQSDIVPAIAGMMAMPVSKNNLGIFIAELAGLWREDHQLHLLYQNALQMLHIVRAKYGTEDFEQSAAKYYEQFRIESESRPPNGEQARLAYEWAAVKNSQDNGRDLNHTIAAMYTFLHHAQEAMSDTASLYNIPRMATGMAMTAIALVLTTLSIPSVWPPSTAGVFFIASTLLYGIMMFASSYVEEEQHFWYWLTPCWIVLLAGRAFWRCSDKTSKAKIATATVLLLVSHRVTVRWNQTGQKHAGDPDIVHTNFPEHHILMWILVLATYITNGVFLHNRSLAGIFLPEMVAWFEVSLIFLAIVFKLNFTQADAPELVQGLAALIREYSEPFSLVFQARAVFGLLAITTIIVIVLAVKKAPVYIGAQSIQTEGQTPLTERLHHLLTLFLMTQTRSPNVPLFLALEIQRACIGWLLEDESKTEQSQRRSVEVAATALLFSHVYYFCMGGSNSISSIDLSNAYNGVGDYNIAAVGLLLFASNWAGPIWWCSATVSLMLMQHEDPELKSDKQAGGDRDWVIIERQKLHEDAVASQKVASKDAGTGVEEEADSWSLYLSCMTGFVSASLLAIMAACTALRTHLFIWTVFSPKYLYAMAWCMCWHLIVNVAFGSLLYALRRIV